MLAVKGSPSKIQKSINGSSVEIACVNSDMETVLAGQLSDVEAVSEKLRTNNIDFKKLNVPYAFHSSQVDPALDSFQEAAAAVTFNAPHVPVLSPLLSAVIRDGSTFNAAYLASHCREKVNFRGALAAGTEDGVINDKTIWIEIGAHPVCTGMIKASLGTSTPAFSSLRRGEDPWKTVANSVSGLYLAGANPNWSAYHQDFESSLECLSLPTYAFDEQNHWLQYVNDWCLRKGDPVESAAPAPVPVEASPKLSTTSIHRIVQEDVQEGKATVTAESDLSDPLLFKAVAGHSINGVGLGPSSLWADMALTLTNYAYKQLRPSDNQPDMNVCHMENPTSLYVRSIKEPQKEILTIKSAVDLAHRQATVTITSKPDNKTTNVHAKCVVAFEDASQWALEWNKKAYLVRDRIELLQEKMSLGKTHRLPRAVVYRLFGSLIDYSETYQGIKEAVLDAANYEAATDLDLQSTSKDGNFHLSPYTIDSVGHLAGFIMNGSGGIESKDQVFISHGWETLRMPTTLQAGKKYHSWVKMQPLGPPKEQVFAGDVHLFDESMQIIGLIEGLKFKGIPRRVLNMVMPAPLSAGSKAPAAKAAPKAAPPKTPSAQKISQPSQKSAPAAEKKKKVAIEVPKAAPASNSIVNQALVIVAAEVGVEMAELADTIQLADLGVDSLMTLTIAGRFREELDLEIDNNAMVDMGTIGNLKKHLLAHSSGQDTAEISDDSSDESDPGLTTGGTTPPDTFEEGYQDSNSINDVAVSDADDAISVIRTTIADEMGIDINELTDTLDLSTIGMDSLMALTVLGALRESTGKEYEPTLFAEMNTLASLRKVLSPPAPAAEQKAPPKAQAPSKPAITEAAIESIAPKVKSNSILLQGNPKKATKKLWLLPDGSGSPTSYADIPAINANELCVYGLSCPFLKEPEKFTCGVIGVTKIYIEEIIRRQPEGPYLIGGWSAGGVFAFEATRQFAALQKANPSKNYKIERLLLLDSPCPYALEPLPQRLHVFFNEIGLLGDGNPANTPKWLLPHFTSAINALKAYQPVLLKDDPYEAPPTFLIWCRDGVCKYPDDPRPPPQDDDPASMKWLLNNRTDFAGNGWEKLVGEDKCEFAVIDGNHFTMMKEPVVSSLSSLCARALL